MKYLSLLITTLFAVGCSSFAHSHDPERMADLASQLKDISAAVDGTLKFSSEKYLSSQALLLAAIDNDKTRLQAFQNYQLIIEIQDNNAILLLCENEIALIEDAGCTAQSDIQHWQSLNKVACTVSINSSEVCDF
ncbi:hypothetical protein [Pseudoalteromonas sp. T1lg22]|uniref:hypothetical protein n=1 Tax=Pseudoalteromonas sp. T1lg22 TaxID=2077096 RepID=UPI000CF5E46D|nr:hypothetical protein [Pseudoalteromonas sp. T1lg22]